MSSPAPLLPHAVLTLLAVYSRMPGMGFPTLVSLRQSIRWVHRAAVCVALSSQFAPANLRSAGCLVIAPTFFSAAMYMLLGLLIALVAPQASWLSPRQFVPRSSPLRPTNRSSAGSRSLLSSQISSLSFYKPLEEEQPRLQRLPRSIVWAASTSFTSSLSILLIWEQPHARWNHLPARRHGHLLPLRSRVGMEVEEGLAERGTEAAAAVVWNGSLLGGHHPSRGVFFRPISLEIDLDSQPSFLQSYRSAELAQGFSGPLAVRPSLPQLPPRTCSPSLRRGTKSPSSSMRYLPRWLSSPSSAFWLFLRRFALTRCSIFHPHRLLDVSLATLDPRERYELEKKVTDVEGPRV